MLAFVLGVIVGWVSIVAVAVYYDKKNNAKDDNQQDKHIDTKA